MLSDNMFSNNIMLSDNMLSAKACYQITAHYQLITSCYQITCFSDNLADNIREAYWWFGLRPEVNPIPGGIYSDSGGSALEQIKAN
jgi:hypothetical protein